jgi:CubicO group peptidase (beta-lactamase class C family)
MKQQRRASIVLLACLVSAASAAAQGLRVATPDAAGLTSSRVGRLRSAVQEYVDRGQIAGAVLLVARGGTVAVLEPVGWMDVEQRLPMRKDTIFRLASMSKPVTSVAAVMLMEEGKLRLGDPVSKYLPAFAQTWVVAPGAQAGAPYGKVPAKRPITIRDLMTHTAGISYGNGAAADEYKAAGISGWYLADRAEPVGAVMERLARLPFAAQPGEKFVYGYNTDILGAVIEKASGLPLDEFLRTRIFEPLRMNDTSFFLPPGKRDRLATVYSIGPDGKRVRAPGPKTGQGEYVDGPRACFSGGAGLLSTAGDYARFLQMLLNGGELDGARLLSPKSVELMTANHIGKLYREDGSLGFGLGFEVTLDVGASGRPGSVGTYRWGSAYYSTFWVDPKERLTSVFLTQLIPAGDVDLQDKLDFLTYQLVR